MPSDAISRCIAEAGVGFLWAPLHHPAMKHWAPIRGELGIRTIFNLLGPICNPAGVKRQVVGVFCWHWVEPIAHVLKNLGAEHVWVVHGDDGLDELTTTGVTDVAELKDGDIKVFEVTPEDAGLKRAALASLKGGDAADNAAAIRDVLGRRTGTLRDIVVLNAAAALIVAGKAAKLLTASREPHASIDSGAPRAPSTAGRRDERSESDAMADILDKITRLQARRDRPRQGAERPLRVIAEYARLRRPGALLRRRHRSQASSTGTPALIAEIKKARPRRA